MQLPLLDVLADVIDIDVLTKDCQGVHVLFLNRRSRKADGRRIGESVAQVFSKAVRNFAGPFSTWALKPY